MSEQHSDRQAEVALLAACLRSATARQEARRHLLPADFDDLRHETIWQAMGQLDRHGKGVDAVTLLTLLGADSAAGRCLVDVVTNEFSIAENVAEYAAIVRGWSVRRQLNVAAGLAQADALNPGVPPATLAARIAAKFIAIRDGGAASEDVTALTLGELLDKADDQPDWLIPGLIERRDRFMLTGEEGLGKSHLLRQIALSAAAGLRGIL